MIQAQVKSKRCRRCSKTKPCSKVMEKSAFYGDKSNPDGYRSYCKPCGAAMSEKYAKAAAAKGGKPKVKAASKGKAKVGAKGKAKPKGKAKATKPIKAKAPVAPVVPTSPLVHEEAKA